MQRPRKKYALARDLLQGTLHGSVGNFTASDMSRDAANTFARITAKHWVPFVRSLATVNRTRELARCADQIIAEYQDTLDAVRDSGDVVDHPGGGDLDRSDPDDPLYLPCPIGARVAPVGVVSRRGHVLLTGLAFRDIARLVAHLCADKYRLTYAPNKTVVLQSLGDAILGAAIRRYALDGRTGGDATSAFRVHSGTVKPLGDLRTVQAIVHAGMGRDSAKALDEPIFVFEAALDSVGARGGLNRHQPLMDAVTRLYGLRNAPADTAAAAGVAHRKSSPFPLRKFPAPTKGEQIACYLANEASHRLAGDTFAILDHLVTLGAPTKSQRLTEALLVLVLSFLGVREGDASLALTPRVKDAARQAIRATPPVQIAPKASSVDYAEESRQLAAMFGLDGEQQPGMAEAHA